MRPLEDIRIVAVEQYGAGPFGSVHLADLGADVIKIEESGTGGDVGRYVPPYADGEDSLFFETFNRNKRSLSLDLATTSGREVFEDLVRHSDAVYSNLRGDVPARIGITYDQLKHVNPSIVCCSLTGFGTTGPRAAQPGYDYILQGLAGWMDLTGEPGGPPTKSGLSIVDYSGGFVAAIALLAGVHAARRDGHGMDCDLSLFDTAVGMLTYPAAWHLNAGFEPARTRHSAHPSLVPFQLFPSADGWLVVGCAKEKFWQRLVAVLDLPALTDPRFATFAGRRTHAGVLLPLLEETFATRATADWLALLEPAGIPCGPVNDVAAALRDPHTLARGLVVETEHPHWGTVRQVASPVRVGDTAPAYRRAPRRGEDLGRSRRRAGRHPRRSRASAGTVHRRPGLGRRRDRPARGRRHHRLPRPRRAPPLDAGPETSGLPRPGPASTRPRSRSSTRCSPPPPTSWRSPATC
jgi:crotonobetainyl-CoA:carnitine CoA-transferase CaiB-like acyl-CoA transferase